MKRFTVLALMLAGLLSNQLSRTSVREGAEHWTRAVILQDIPSCLEYEDGSVYFSRFAPRESVDIKRPAAAAECESLPRFRVEVDTWMPCGREMTRTFA